MRALVVTIMAHEVDTVRLVRSGHDSVEVLSSQVTPTSVGPGFFL